MIESHTGVSVVAMSDNHIDLFVVLSNLYVDMQYLNYAIQWTKFFSHSSTVL